MALPRSPVSSSRSRSSIVGGESALTDSSGPRGGPDPRPAGTDPSSTISGHLRSARRVYRLHGGDQVPADSNVSRPSQRADGLAQFGREHIVGLAGHGMECVANPEEDLESLCFLLLMLRGELADQVLRADAPIRSPARAQTAAAGLDIDGHQPIRGLGRRSSLGFTR